MLCNVLVFQSVENQVISGHGFQQGFYFFDHAAFKAKFQPRGNALPPCVPMSGSGLLALSWISPS